MLAKIKKNILNSTIAKKTANCAVLCFNYLHKKFLWGMFSKIDEKFFKFLFVGFMNTVFSYMLYAIFITIGLVANLALFFQYIIGVMWNFKTTGIIVFRSHDNRLIFKFVLCYVFTFIINSICLRFLTKYLNDYIAQAILVLPIAMISFLILKFFVFKKSN